VIQNRQRHLGMFSLRSMTGASRAVRAALRAFWSVVYFSAVFAAGCGTDSGKSDQRAGAAGALSGGSGGASGGSEQSVAGSTVGGSNSGAGSGGGAGASGKQGVGGDVTGAAGTDSAGGGGSGGGAGGGGAPTEVKMCEQAVGSVPTFKRVAASDKAIAGAVGVVGNPENPDIIYVPQHFTGDVRVVQGGKLQDEPLLHVDVRQDPPGREQGLLSIVLHPEFKTNHLMYVYYSAASPVGESNVEEFRLDSPSKATFVRKVYQMEHSHKWHNGGNLQFGEDDWLYVSIGDNQGDCGPSCAQKPEGPYGRIRKLDVSAQDPQSTTKTFAYGLRNPWRWSFDPLTFDVTIGDVGDSGSASEKVFFASKADADGKNWGWAPGTLDNRSPAGTLTTLANDGGAVIGGIIYRGSNPKMAGACGLIFFGHLKGAVYTIKTDGSQKMQQQQLSGTNDLGSFGRDANGEIYLTYLGGQVFRIDAN
jgi:hypothetical protein